MPSSSSSSPHKQKTRTKKSDAEVIAEKSQQKMESILDAFLYGRGPGEVRSDSPRDERAERLHVLEFFRKYKDEDHPWPLDGLNIQIVSQGGTLRMWAEVRDDSSFVEAVNRARSDIRYWRDRLTHFNNRQRWEGQPFQNIRILAKSKKGGPCLRWLKTVDPKMAERISKERGDGLTYGQLAKEINRTIEGWLIGRANWKRGRKPWDPNGELESMAMLRGLGFTFQRAKGTCEQLLDDIEQGRCPFHRGRAKYCYPVTAQQIRKLIDRLSKEKK